MRRLQILAVLVVIFTCLVAKVHFEETSGLERPIDIITDSPATESFVARLFVSGMGPSMEELQGYRHRIYRLLTYSIHFLGGLASLSEQERRWVEIAVVYHDIGLWSDKNLAYIAPSAALFNEHFAPELNTEHLALITSMIDNHYKLTSFDGPKAEFVNALRLASWIDITQGFLSKGMPRHYIEAVQSALPNLDFHWTLLNLPFRLHAWNLGGFLRLLSVVKW